MPMVRPGGGHNADLSSSPFPILGAIGVLEDVVFPHGLDAQQLGAGPGRRDELVGRVPPDPVDAVDQKPVGFCRSPATEKAGKPPPPPILELLLTTPALSSRSRSKLRPFSGRSLTCCSVINPEVELSVVFTSGASSVTVTSSAAPPTSSVRSITAC